jgi:DNA-binding CsgD family transcriptional regulator
MLRNIEFAGLPDGEIEVRKRDDNTVFTLKQTDYDFINEFNETMLIKKPFAHKQLHVRYINSKDNRTYYAFLICRGFIKCNFSAHDNRLDIDENGVWHTEFILCPRMGECIDCGLVCNSPDKSELSEAELNVLRLIAQGLTNEIIAEMLYKSINTIHTHRNHILKKLGLNNTAQLVAYWYQNNLK